MYAPKSSAAHLWRLKCLLQFQIFRTSCNVQGIPGLTPKVIAADLSNSFIIRTGWVLMSTAI